MIVDHGLAEVKTAIHEGGHAVSVNDFGAKLVDMEFCPKEEAAAHIDYRDFEHFGDREHISVSLAGKSAEYEAAKYCEVLRKLAENNDGAASDFREAVSSWR